MSSRRLYKLLSWDYETNIGKATDGTRFDNEPIHFDVHQRDLDAEHNGHLLLGEVFSAEEAPDRTLHDIVIERGSRAVQPARPPTHYISDDIVEAYVEKSREPELQVGQAPLRVICTCGPGKSCSQCGAPRDTPFARFVTGPSVVTTLDSLRIFVERLESRVKVLENHIFIREDDHK